MPDIQAVADNSDETQRRQRKEPLQGWRAKQHADEQQGKAEANRPLAQDLPEPPIRRDKYPPGAIRHKGNAAGLRRPEDTPNQPGERDHSGPGPKRLPAANRRSEEHTSELQSRE